MKITRIEPPLVETAEDCAIAQLSEPAPVAPEPVENPEARAERQAADHAAIAGTRALVVELQGRLADVQAQAQEHRQAAEQPFAGEPAALASHLETTEKHRAEAVKLHTEAETLRRQVHVAMQLLDKLVQEQEQEQAAETQAKGRVLLKDAIEKYVAAAAALADVVVDLGAASIAAGASGSFAASVRALLLPDMPALGATLPALPGFHRRREGQAVATGDPEFQRRMNQVFSRGISI